MENAISEGRFIDTTLSPLVKSLKHIFEQLDQILQVPEVSCEVSNSSFNKQEVIGKINELIPLIADADASSEDVCHSLMELCLGTKYYDSCKAIAALLDNIEYQTALELIKSLNSDLTQEENKEEGVYDG
jgi:hypothetical protein